MAIIEVSEDGVRRAAVGEVFEQAKGWVAKESGDRGDHEGSIVAMLPVPPEARNGYRPIVIGWAGSYGKVFVWKSRRGRFRLRSGPG